MSEPAIIHDKHFDSALLCLTGNIQKFFCIEIKISCFPVIDEDRAFFVIVFTSDYMISVEIMITPAHLTKTCP